MRPPEHLYTDILNYFQSNPALDPYTASRRGWGAAKRPASTKEKQRLVAALDATNWMVYGARGAAKLLGMSPEKLRYRMQKYGLRRPSK